jgi:hypothetical protein
MSATGAGPVLAAAIAPIVGNPNLAHVATDVPALPPSFPAQLKAEMAWTGSDFSRKSDHILVLNDAEQVEVRAAVESFKCKYSLANHYRRVLLTFTTALGLDGDLVEPANFPLPTLGARLKDLSRDVHQGRGFCVVRGIDPASYAVEDLTLVYLGVQSYIAEQRGRQDKRGNMLGKFL